MKAESTDLLYRTVAAEIAASISRRVLPPGARLPSVRSFSASRGVSVPTVVEAYHLLEDDGLVESRPRSGYYVRVLAPGLPPCGGPSSKLVHCRSRDDGGVSERR